VNTIEERPFGLGPSGYFDSAEGVWRDPEAESIAFVPGGALGAPAMRDQPVPWWQWQEGKRPAGWTERDEQRWSGEGSARVLRSSRGCHLCRQPIPEDEGPDDFRQVLLDNGLKVRACLRCWCLWPRDQKLFPAFGYGRGVPWTTAELVQLLRETAPAPRRDWIGDEPPAGQEERAA
jgi:hypothetical protein